MSSNNQLIILKNSKGKFEVHHNLCIDNPFIPDKHSLLKTELNLVDAIKFSKDYCNEYPYVEYGFTVDDSCLK